MQKGLVLVMTLKKKKKKWLTATGDFVGRRCVAEFSFFLFFFLFVSEAPIVPSLERVRHKETQFQSCSHHLFNLYP